MPRVKLVNPIVWNGEPRDVGEEFEVSEKDAFILCNGYGDAVRVDGKEMVARFSGAVSAVIEVRDPVAEHRDPVVPPQKRKGK